MIPIVVWALETVYKNVEKFPDEQELEPELKLFKLKT